MRQKRLVKRLKHNRRRILVYLSIDQIDRMHFEIGGLVHNWREPAFTLLRVDDGSSGLRGKQVHDGRAIQTEILHINPLVQHRRLTREQQHDLDLGTVDARQARSQAREREEPEPALQRKEVMHEPVSMPLRQNGRSRLSSGSSPSYTTRICGMPGRVMPCSSPASNPPGTPMIMPITLVWISSKSC